MNQGPLAEFKVLELAGILAGPLVGQFCAELGADVIKVEQPAGGDPTRGWRLAGESPDDDVSAYFSCTNWGKRSIALDLNAAEGVAVAHRLAAVCDVVITSYKRGDDIKFQLDYPTLKQINPRIIYLKITAYGDDDARPGFDAVIQAESGFTGLNGEADGGPVKMPVALMDLLAAHQIKEGLLLALLQRERTGEGAYLTTSLFASAVASLANQAGNYLYAGVVPQRIGSEHPNIVPYGTMFQTRDGRELVVAVGTERQFRAFAIAIGVPELSTDSRFETNAARVQHRHELNPILVRQIRNFTAAKMKNKLEQHKIPFGFVNDMAEVFAAAGAGDQLLEGGRGVRTIALSGDVTGQRRLSPPPHLNEHRTEILNWLESVEPKPIRFPSDGPPSV